MELLRILVYPIRQARPVGIWADDRPQGKENKQMSWNKVIERVHGSIAQRVGHNNSNKHQQNNVVAVKISMLVNADGIPLVWTVESRKIEPNDKAREMLGLINSVDISQEI